MGWLDRWIRRRATSATPWAFPRRLDLVSTRSGSDALAMTAFAHDLHTGDLTLACWTFVSDGLIGYGQKELVLTIARRPNEHPELVAREIAAFLSTVQKHAAQGRRVDVGAITVFEGTGPGGARGIAYMRPAPLERIDTPSLALAAIPLMGAEADVAAFFGVTRVLGRLAMHYRYYPCPPWWDRGRATIAALKGDDTSILTGLVRRKVPGVSGRLERDGFRLRVHPSAREKLVEALDEAASRDVPFALLTDPDIEADGLLAWRPGTEGLQAATPPGSHGARVSVAFVAFSWGPRATGGRFLEDGVGLMFMPPAWDAFREAVRRCETVTMAPTVGNAPITLEWIAETYMSPIDGRAYIAEEGWRTFYPQPPSSSHRHRPASRIVLLVNLSERASGEALAAYLEAIEREFSRAYGDRIEFTEVFLRVEIYPGEPARVTERSDADDVRIAELVARVPLPAVPGMVAFECRLTNRPDPV